MDKERRRSFRRSIRHYRRSSGFLEPSILPADMKENKAIKNDKLSSTYGSMWLEEENEKQLETAIICTKDSISVPRENWEEPPVSTSLFKHHEIAEKFSINHHSMVHEEYLTQHLDMTEHSDTGIFQFQDFTNFGGVTQSQPSASSVPTHINLLHEDVLCEENNSSVKEILSGSQIDTFINRQIDENIYIEGNTFSLNESQRNKNTDIMGKGTGGVFEYQYKTFNCTTNSMDQDIRNNFTENIRVTKNKIRAGDMISALSTRAIRQIDRPIIQPDRSTHSDNIPKKRKRLSLNKIQTNIIVEKSDPEKLSVPNLELKENLLLESEVYVHKSNEIADISSTICTCEPVANWLCENQENINFTDCEISKELPVFNKLDIEKDFLDLSTMNNEKKVKQRALSKSKANRRSSRLFNLHEMPLSEFLSEQVTGRELESEISSPVTEASSPKLVANWLCENQENINFTDCEISKELLAFKELDIEKDFLDLPTMNNEKKVKQRALSKSKANRRSSRLFNLHEMPLSEFLSEQVTGRGLESEISSPVTETSSYKLSLLDNDSSTISNKTTELNGSHITDFVVVKEISDDFANLCVTENRDVNTIGSAQEIVQNNYDRRHSVIYTTSSNIDDQELHAKDFISDIYRQSDSLGIYSSSHGSPNSLENVFNDSEMKCHLDISSADDKCHNFSQFADTAENGQSFNDLISSPIEDVDMCELPSGSIFSEEETQPESTYKKSHTRVRRSRKSWDMGSKKDSDKERKVPRRFSKKDNTEKQTVHTLIPDNTQFSASSEDTVITAQISDSQTSSEISTSQSNEARENTVINPALVRLYQNKNFVMPQPRSWEVIKESPDHNQPHFSKQQRKCFLQFDNITRAKLQRRHKKATEVYKKIGGRPEAITHEEFESKMLDIQLFVDGF